MVITFAFWLWDQSSNLNMANLSRIWLLDNISLRRQSPCAAPLESVCKPYHRLAQMLVKLHRTVPMMLMLVPSYKSPWLRIGVHWHCLNCSSHQITCSLTLKMFLRSIQHSWLCGCRTKTNVPEQVSTQQRLASHHSKQTYLKMCNKPFMILLDFKIL